VKVQDLRTDQNERPRSAAKRELILDAAMRHFADHGYQGARVEDIALELGIAKGSIFQHFGSKAGLFLAAYKRAVTSLPAWLDAPDAVVAGELDPGLFHRHPDQPQRREMRIEQLAELLRSAMGPR
jgi:AcrR family transcriptional regulator